MAYGVDNSLRLEDFGKNLRVEVISLNEEDIEFDIIGIDAALANAFRRILIAEVFSCSHSPEFSGLEHVIGFVPVDCVRE